MTIRNLDYVFTPKSVALIGASRKDKSVGGVIAKNLMSGGFDGPIMFVNPKATSIRSSICYPDISSLPCTPELSIICTPSDTTPKIVTELAARGGKAAVVISAGFSETGDDGKALEVSLLKAAQPHLFRLIGPNCVGLILPRIGLNASFAHCGAITGDIALVSQSGAILTSILDWAEPRGIGFSHLVSLGGMADVDVGDMLDYLARDQEVKSILLYIEHITHPKKFMSAARAAARLKPVVVIKPGRHEASATAVASHTGALAGADAVYDAAFNRAGMLRVSNLERLFDAAELLSRHTTVHGNKLAILTNGGGMGILATDRLLDQGGELSSLSDDTLRSLDEVLPSTWSHGNPVDIIGDATSERYKSSFARLAKDPDVDAILALNCPTAVADRTEAAKAIASISTEIKKPVFTSWVGGDGARQAQQVFSAAQIPTFETPGQAVDAFMQLVNHGRNQALLTEVPDISFAAPQNGAEHARKIIDYAEAANRSWLSELEAKALLTEYGVPVVPTEQAHSVDEAVRIAERIQYPVALKIVSPQITHKSDVGGVALNIHNREHLIQTASDMHAKVHKSNPEATLEGYTVQPMATKPGAHELIVGFTHDDTFGPVVMFGHGGTAVEIIRDRAFALPPLNAILANDLIGRTKVSKLLAGYRDRPPVDEAAIVRTLLAIAQVAQDFPAIRDLEINPLWADHQGVLALDARIGLDNARRTVTSEFAIAPYPNHLEREISDRTGHSYIFRPIRPEDVSALREFISCCDRRDVRLRFFTPMLRLPDQLAVRLTQIDYDREMAFVAFEKKNESDPLRPAGFVHLAMDPDKIEGDYSIIVRTDIKGRGLGYQLMLELIGFARSVGLRAITGEVLAENNRMLTMCQELGFEIERDKEDTNMVRVRKTVSKSAENLAEMKQ